MGISDLFRRNTPQESAQYPSAVVEFDDESIVCRRPSGLVETVMWAELRAVFIQTTADGPAVDDLFWVLLGEKTGCVVPSEADGTAKLLERLHALPGFDFHAAIQAMTCIDEAKFLCWQRPN